MFPVQAFQKLIYVSTLVFGEASSFLLPWKRVFKVTDAQVSSLFMFFRGVLFLLTCKVLIFAIFLMQYALLLSIIWSSEGTVNRAGMPKVEFICHVLMSLMFLFIRLNLLLETMHSGCMASRLNQLVKVTAEFLLLV